jgi:Na+/H+ antiporter NhaD/arsenite permease-like protein
MRLRAALATLPSPLLAAGGGKDALDLPWWSAVPFVLLLACIALLPLVAGHFWHKNRNKFLLSVVLGVPIAAYLLSWGESGAHALLHGLSEYVSFIVLIGALYVIAGGILLEGDLKGRPLSNTGLLALGAVLANFIGTTGASMLLIRPYLRINIHRQRRTHLPIFFIFVVSNVGGLLTPLGDPPLFLGYLKGIDFFWTVHLWPQWLAVNGTLLVLFFLWDSLAARGDKDTGQLPGGTAASPLRLRGWINFLFLAGVVVAVLAKSQLKDTVFEHAFVSEGAIALMAALSMFLGPRNYRQMNNFSWEPILEVAVLFIGIFVTMVPALELLKLNGDRLGVHEPWQFFWLTGSLSSFLDNAPTYVTFGALAAHSSTDFATLMHTRPVVLAAISCGAVFMGAMTYIGNGPNFMVKAITEESGIPMPTFLGYTVYSCLILLPVFALITFLFFTTT